VPTFNVRDNIDPLLRRLDIAVDLEIEIRGYAGNARHQKKRTMR